MPVFFPLFINTASPNAPVPAAQQAKVLLKYHLKPSEYSQMKRHVLPSPRDSEKVSFNFRKDKAERKRKCLSPCT